MSTDVLCVKIVAMKKETHTSIDPEYPADKKETSRPAKEPEAAKDRAATGSPWTEPFSKREKSVRMFGYPSARKRRQMRKEEERLAESGELDPNAQDDSKPEEPPIPYRMSPQGATALAVMLSLGLVLTILGIVGLCLYVALKSAIFAGNIWVLPTFLAALVIGVILLPVSIRRYRFVMRFFSYIKAIGQRTEIPLDELAKESRQEADTVLADINKMIRLQYFPDGHLSEDQTILFLIP